MNNFFSIPHLFYDRNPLIVNASNSESLSLLWNTKHDRQNAAYTLGEYSNQDENSLNHDD